MKKNALQVLLVEDNSGDARLLRNMFSTEPPGSFELTHVLRLSEALALLAIGEMDIVLLDMGLPDGHGLDTVRRAHAVAPDVPLIVLTGLDDEALAAQAMKEGAQDYLIKGQIENRALPRALRHSIESKRMQIETDLIRSHQLQFKDEFLSHVSHELRSPLTAIHQFVTILLDGLAGDLTPDQRQFLEIALRNIKQLDSMINDLLEVTGLQAGKLVIDLQCTSVADAIVFVVDTLQGAAKAKGITLNAEVGKVLPLVYADPTRVRQILIVLVDNAIKFTPASGAVKIKAHNVDGDAGLIVLEVSDTGPGISPDMTARIFERLYQAPDQGQAGRKGLGLGLYICKELVKRHGGEIWARTDVAQGAVLCFTLPVFSLPKLIAPTLLQAKRADRPVTLLIAELGSRTGWLSDEVRAQHCKGIRDLLRRCLQSEFDVLLPKIGPTGSTELFFVVALADSIGSQAIGKRIQEKFDAWEADLRAGLTLSTRYRSIRAISSTTSESVDAFLRKASAEIEQRMNQETSPRMAANVE